ncbi:alpha/beta hydrolase family protein [Variovorax saccharolyticus]|uniref:alpha/beta hydrolase family protein n=1 Tax=Variovorax saccharolyticus TaxID=3053516 RepID=UPI002577814F|nr:alpha/beta fold hydrolase [Variovorax sp. J31P216]MDM0025228.1 alpha/beta fold hydrolase [Variovorax sp. J31P216]
MQRRTFMNAGTGVASAAALASAAAAGAQPSGDAARPDQRMGQKYRFNDPNMDLFFMAAMSWGPTGGLDIGQAHYIASTIKDGDADSWVQAFASYGDLQNAQADAWKQRGWRQAAGEARLKAFASYRSSWQFAAPGEGFASLYARHKAAFASAMSELALPATFFVAPYQGKGLPGVHLQNPAKDAPLVLVIGGADTCFEDLFLTVGRNLLNRGFSVALVDLPGQGITQASGLYWETEAEKPVAAVIDLLVERFGARPGRIALLGLSLGGYFVARAAGHETRVATVMASTPFPDPADLFAKSVRHAMATGGTPTDAALRSYQSSLWKAGARSPEEFVARTAGMKADPSLVSLPFLSILGAGDSPVFAAQAKAWHRDIRSPRKSFVLLDAATGADGHVQVNNRLRLAQECCGWLGEIFAG